MHLFDRIRAGAGGARPYLSTLLPFILPSFEALPAPSAILPNRIIFSE
jgi:hypothetical protein